MRKIWNKIFIEKDVIHIIVFISIIALFFCALLFLWKREFFIWDSPLDETLLGTLGDFIGGIIGSAWALIGVILFYLALKEQRSDSQINRMALNKQIEALKMQTNEFGLQKEELYLTRNVFKEQAKTLKKQQFESTFFDMLSLYNYNVNNIGTANSEGQSESFGSFSRELFDLSIINEDPIENHKVVINSYKELFYEKKTEISHYFRIVYRIMRFIDLSSISEEDKQTYSKIIRSQFSEKELLILYYNSHFVFGKKFIPIALKYNLFKHLPDDSKIEFKNFHTSNVNFGFNRLIFLKEIKLRIKDFISEIKEDIEINSYPVSRSSQNEEAGIILNLEILNFEVNEIKISFLNIDLSKFEKYFGFSIENGKEYFYHHFHHFFILSKYLDYQGLNYQIGSDLINNEIFYDVKNNNQLEI